MSASLCEESLATSLFEEADGLLHLVLQSMDLGICLIDLDGRCSFINRAGASMLRYAADDLIGADLHSLVHHTLPDGTPYPVEDCPIHHTLRSGQGIRGENEVFRRRNGTAFQVEYSCHPLANIRVSGAVLTFRDITERKRRERELHDLNAAMKNAVEGISLLDLQGRYRSVNRAYARMLGYAPAEMIGLCWTSTVHPDDLPRTHAAYEQMLAQGKAQAEVRGIRKDGSLFYKEFVLVKAYNQHGDFAGHHCFMKDVTEKRVANETLQYERRFLQAVLESIEEPIIACDASGVLTLFNRAARALCGRDAEPLPADEWPARYGFCYPDARGLMAPQDMALARALRGEQIRNAEMIVKTPWEEDRTLVANARALYDSDSNLMGAVAAHVDVTEERRAMERQRLLAAERDRLLRRLQLHMERMPLAYVQCDADGRIVDWNPAAERVFGYAKQEVLGMGPPYEKILPASSREEAMRIVDRIRSGDMSAHVVLENQTKHGPIVICEWFNTPIINDDGEFVGFVCLGQEITDRKVLEEQLRQSQKMEAVGQLAGGIAHDFNNLMTIIIGYSDLLFDTLPAEGGGHEILEEIKKAGERAAMLTRQLLMFSKKQVLEPRELDLNEVVGETEKMLRRVIGEDIELVTNFEVELGGVKADPGQLQQVILNLAVNARDAMPRGGKLTIRTSNVELGNEYASVHAGVQPGCYVKLEVIDTGFGMSDDVKQRIFEPFFTTKEQGKGTGLGLPVVHGVIKQSGGHVEIESQLDVGTSVTILLPRIATPAETERYSRLPSKLPRGRETILLVEDEEAVRRLSRNVLLDCGYTILEAANGDEAIDIALKCSVAIDLLLTDVVMPCMGGKILAERLLESRPELKVLYVSGYLEDAVVRHGIAKDDVAFLPKPHSPAALAQKVREVLDAAADAAVSAAVLNANGPVDSG